MMPLDADSTLFILLECERKPFPCNDWFTHLNNIMPRYCIALAEKKMCWPRPGRFVFVQVFCVSGQAALPKCPCFPHFFRVIFHVAIDLCGWVFYFRQDHQIIMPCKLVENSQCSLLSSRQYRRACQQLADGRVFSFSPFIFSEHRPRQPL